MAISTGDPRTFPDDVDATAVAGARLYISVQPDPLWFDDFYAAYDAAFRLPSEKESAVGLKACLSLNFGADYAQLSAAGHYCEVLMLLRAAEDGRVLGGANLAAFRHPPSAADAPGLVTANLNYVFLDRRARGQGWFPKLIATLPRKAAALFGSSSDAFVFCEMNDPLALTDADYAADSAHAGIDQFDRLAIWARQGLRLVDIDYAQPALSEDQEADEGLLYGLINPTGSTVPACLLQQHFARFFAVSVLKGADIMIDKTAAPQLRRLAAACAAGTNIRLFDLTPVLPLARAERGQQTRFLDICRGRSA